MSVWKPGDVAMRDSQFGSPGQLTIAVPFCGNDNHVSGIHWHHASGGYDRIDGSPAYRRMVVIDPMDASQVARLADLIRDGRGRGLSWGRATTEALREFANPTPVEPTDPVARVQDRRENIWRLLADGDWVCTSGPDIGEYVTWSRLTERGPLTVTVPE